MAFVTAPPTDTMPASAIGKNQAGYVVTIGQMHGDILYRSPTADGNLLNLSQGIYWGGTDPAVHVRLLRDGDQITYKEPNQ